MQLQEIDALIKKIKGGTGVQQKAKEAEDAAGKSSLLADTGIKDDGDEVKFDEAMYEWCLKLVDGIGNIVERGQCDNCSLTTSVFLFVPTSPVCVGATHQCPLKSTSKLPLPLYADVGHSDDS